MRFFHKASLYALMTGVLLPAPTLFCMQSTPATPKQTQPDNTRMNKGDQKKGAATADKQSQSKSDVEITRQIRKAITADKSLSTAARNVKIVTKDGKVTLKGPVKTAEEKDSIAVKAAGVAGAANVTNDIEVKGSTRKNN